MAREQSERERFLAFMQQGWVKRFRSDVIVYALETEWLRPYPPTFYIGVTQYPDQRLQEHRADVLENRKRFPPSEFQRLLCSEEILAYGHAGCKWAKQGITATCLADGSNITLTALDTVCERDYAYTIQETRSMPVLDQIMVDVGEVNSRFSAAVLERERRWIFRKFQEGCNLTNVELLCRSMIRALRAHPQLDVLATPFSSADWNPIIEAYCQDEPLLRKHDIS